MDQQLLQRTRYLLQTRFRKIRTAHTGHFKLITQQVLRWLEGHPIIGAIIHHLDQIPGDHHQEIQHLLNSSDIGSFRYYVLSVQRSHPRQEHEPEFVGYTPKTLEEHASACLQTLRATVAQPQMKFYEMLAVYLTQELYEFGIKKDPLEAIKDIAVRDLYEYLDEQLDGINAVNGLLRKYKQSVEWFQRDRIQQIFDEGYGGKKGERALALHLQHYIFNQGVEFIVEPSSASGEADLLLRDPSGQYTIIDAKLINRDAAPSDIARKIAEGFNQVARYCGDYNQPEGFLAVFVNDDISIHIEIEQSDVFRFFKIGGHVIYYIEINVSQRPSASKSGKAKRIPITEDMLTKAVEEVQHQEDS